MDIRELSTLQIVFVYNTYMKEDFPADELKPMKAILDMMEHGNYQCLGMYHEDEFVAYAFFVVNKERKTLLLDYLAVCGEYRSRGYGGVFLKEMRRFYEGERVIVLECESERTAPDETQRSIRRRRIAFYERNGCCMSRVKSWLFQVEYDILYLPVTDQKPRVREELEWIYHSMFPESILKSGKYLRIWERHNLLKTMSGVSGGKLVERASLCTGLGFGDRPPKVISLVGGGGKTSTMFQLADELFEQGLRVLVTTSTHIVRPENPGMGIAETVEAAAALAMEKAGGTRFLLTAGKPVPNGKLAAPDGLGDAAVMERLMTAFDVILIEADGAKKCPVKVPAEYEPVIVPQTELVIACAGLDAVGERFRTVCFRYEEAGEWLNRPEDAVVTEADLAKILTDERGSRKGVGARQYRIVLNKADGPARMKTAWRVVEKLPEELQEACVVTSYENLYGNCEEAK